MKQFRTLKADEIECRIAQIKENGLSLLLYKTARTDADILDETFGADRWENDFKLVDGVLYGGIGIDYKGDGKLVWKWDAGTESNTEAEKGRASDAFKRAGFKHGIGRELYSAPFIWVTPENCKISPYKSTFKCYDRFEVESISYDKSEKICGLVIMNRSNGKVAFKMGKTATPPAEQPPTPVNYAEIFCDDCGDILRDVTKRDGEIWHPEQIEAYSKRRFGRCLCPDCQKVAFSKEKT